MQRPWGKSEYLAVHFRVEWWTRKGLSSKHAFLKSRYCNLWFLYADWYRSHTSCVGAERFYIPGSACDGPTLEYRLRLVYLVCYYYKSYKKDEPCCESLLQHILSLMSLIFHLYTIRFAQLTKTLRNIEKILDISNVLLQWYWLGGFKKFWVS